MCDEPASVKFEFCCRVSYGYGEPRPAKMETGGFGGSSSISGIVPKVIGIFADKSK